MTLYNRCQKKPIFTNVKKRFEHIELPVKLLDYFLRSNKSNINQSGVPLYLLAHAHCAQCSPSIPLWLASHLLAPAGGRTQSPDRALCIPVSHDQRRACLFFLLVYQAFELGVEVALNHRSAVTHHKVNLLKFPLRSSSFDCTYDTFVLLMCFCVFHL